jgi:hypothetical protein
MIRLLILCIMLTGCVDTGNNDYCVRGTPICHQAP